MGAEQHLETIGKLHDALFGTAEERELAKRLAAEKARANANMAERFANLHMPDDIRQRAKSWGMQHVPHLPRSKRNLSNCASSRTPRGTF